jgi:peroxiredoxin
MKFFGHRSRLPEPGAVAPAFRLSLLGGGEASLQELASRGPFLLTFFKISCPVCQMTLPYLERLHAAGALPVYTVSQNDAADTEDFNRHFGLTLPALLDSEDEGFPASEAYGITNVPTTFLISRDSTVVTVIEGWRKAEFTAVSPIALFHAGESVPEWKAG